MTSCSDVPQYICKLEDRISFFQQECYLSEARLGYGTNLVFVSKSGVSVDAHQAVLLPQSSYLKLLVEMSNCCGCAEDVPVLFMADWDHGVIQILIDLLYLGSVTLTGFEVDELQKLLLELGFAAAQDQLVLEPILHFPYNKSEDSTVQNIMPETLSVTQKQLTAPVTETYSNKHYQKIVGIRRTSLEEVETVNIEQVKVIEALCDILKFLNSVQVRNKESFAETNKALGDLFHSLRYLPLYSPFDFIPTEIKSRIFSYLCNSGAFIAASVCQEWKTILQERLLDLKEITIGRHCSNKPPCQDQKCVMFGEMMEASITLKLDVCLSVCHPLAFLGHSMDPALVAEGLTSATSFSLISNCKCVKGVSKIFGFIMNHPQTKMLLETINRRNEPMKNITLSGVTFDHMDQDFLIKTLLKTSNKLTLGTSNQEIFAFDNSQLIMEPLLDGDMFIEILLQNGTEINTMQLNLQHLSYPNSSCNDLANALCQVENVSLGLNFQLSLITAKGLIQNILTQQMALKTLIILSHIDWPNVISPDDLKLLMTKVKACNLAGKFSVEQKEVVHSIPRVKSYKSYISKIADSEAEDADMEEYPSLGPYQCEICQQIDRTKEKFVYHIKSLHKGMVDKSTIRSPELDLEKRKRIRRKRKETVLVL